MRSPRTRIYIYHLQTNQSIHTSPHTWQMASPSGSFEATITCSGLKGGAGDVLPPADPPAGRGGLAGGGGRTVAPSFLFIQE